MKQLVWFLWEKYIPTPFQPYTPNIEEFNFGIERFSLHAAFSRASKASNIERIDIELSKLDKKGRIDLLQKMQADIDIKIKIKGSDYFDNAKGEIERRLADEKYYSVEDSVTNDKDSAGVKDPMDLIEPFFKELFLTIESKALGDSKKWSSKVRCAAFCELLWDKKYFVVKNNRIKECKDFAWARYNEDIKNQLGGTKKPDRKTHKNQLIRLFS